MESSLDATDPHKTRGSTPDIASDDQLTASHAQLSNETLRELDDIELGLIAAEKEGFPLPESGYHAVGVAFEGLTVYGSGATHKGVESFEIAALKMWDIVGLMKRFLNIKSGAARPIISDFYGICPPGESMLVLGRPGSGCSTLLRVLANERAPFIKIDGHVQWANISGKEAEIYAGDLVFNHEEEIHAAILTVGQTLDTDLTLKRPPHQKGKSNNGSKIDKLLSALGMIHTKPTMVGDSFVRGVSGGERKRVSLLEMLTMNAALICWDNCVRGLDSAVALHFLRLIKQLGRATGITNIVSIYQTSQDMYDKCFDRVVVIYEGRMVFSGLTSDAEAYFLQQGWYKKPRQTTADFLTSCTSISERKATKANVPRTPDEMAAYFRASPEFAKLQQEITEYKQFHVSASNTAQFQEAVQKSKAILSGKATPYKANFFQQVAALCVRQIRLTLAEKSTFVIRVVSNTLNAVSVGAMAYKPPDNASGAFTTAGALFFTILYFVIFGYGEVAATVNSRPLQIKHRKLGFYHPGAVIIAQMLVDVPLYAVQTLMFSAIYYFLVGLNSDARYFFTFWFVTFTLYMAISNMYRAIGSWSPNLSVAVRYGGLALSVVLSTSGFILPVPYQHRWISWLRRATPGSYALEALLANEFRTRTLVCGDSDMVPSGSGYTDSAYQTCSIMGSAVGSDSVSGIEYLATKYDFHPGNIWRNIGIIWAMYIIYAILIIIGSSLLVRDSGSSSTKIFKRGGKKVDHAAGREKVPEILDNRLSLSISHAHAETALVRTNTTRNHHHGSVFTFKDVSYTVKVSNGDKRLLNQVSGKVMPGELTALMGASGAGKTTLLDVISQRKTSGIVEGSFSIGGQALDTSFGRRTGFCMQADLHDPFSTVRECLEFSALLRQDASFSRAEKLAYVDEVIDLLELGPIADALIGNADIGGLGIEERKRVTIGVELAARPESLLFLDEPTSGLDSQAAFEIVSFLRKISKAAGLSVLCTIHQPSGDLFEMFDSVVLLAPGGNTVYAGETGTHAQTVCNYFARLGAPCPPSANPAEHILETIAPVGGSKIDWPGLWRDSDEAKNLLREIDNIASVVEGVAQTPDESSIFAASYFEHCRELLKRHFRWQWRNGSYLVSKFVGTIFFGLYVGFYFYKLQPSVVGVQALSLSQIIVAQSAPPIMIDIAFFYQNQFDLFIARERNGIYSWKSLVTSIIIVEIPSTVGACILAFLCFFWTMGLDSSAGAGGLEFLTWTAWGLFISTSGVLLGAVCPNAFSVAYILSYLWNCYMGLSNAFFSHQLTPSPFRYFFSWIDPLRFYFGAMLSADISPLRVTCKASELTLFNTPDGQTCQEYASAFLATAAGYLLNPDATSDCEYCQYTYASTYMEGQGFAFDKRWRDWGLSLLFLISNVALAFGLTYLVRIRPLYK